MVGLICPASCWCRPTGG